MECYHGVISLDHEIKGKLNIEQKDIDFSGGRGYIEKDWGRAMPRAWVWLQCNHFNEPGISLTASIAVIPWGPFSFNGFIVGLLLNGELHRFATYTGAHLEKATMCDNAVQLIFSDQKKKLQINTKRIGGSPLKAPTVSQMDRRITETQSAEVDFCLSEFVGGRWQIIYTSSGNFARLEVVGEI